MDGPEREMVFVDQPHPVWADDLDDRTEILADAESWAPLASSGGARAKPPRGGLRLWHFSWGASLLIHGAVLGAAILLVRAVDPAQPEGTEGGGTGDIVLQEGDPRPAVQQGLPWAPAQDVPMPRQTADSSPEAPADTPVDFESAATIHSLVSQSMEDDSPIGVGTQIAGAPAASHKQMPRTTSNGNGHLGAESSHAASGQAVRGSPVAGGSGATAPGFPAALAGAGGLRPQYPYEARRRGQQGVVTIEFQVHSDGTLGTIRVIRDPGFPLLRQAAVAAAQRLRQYRFTPATLNGRPVEGWLTQPFEFVLRRH